jgi:glutamyl-tRNA synthetase/glutamyl-Q tRNA(Asp) synthetase
MSVPPLGRFAPSPTGPAHPGTLLSALLVWLDARLAGGRVLLRLEDLDRTRSEARWAAAMEEDLAWLGLDFDERVVQSERHADHARALDRLAAQGRLYGCTCSRSTLRRTASIGADGSRVYPGTCRERVLDAAGWRSFSGSVRLRLPEGPTTVPQLYAPPHRFHPAQELGDPVVRRKDGAVAYHLAVVVDDLSAGVTRVVRGRDLFFATGVHACIYALLDAPVPAHWHHPLLLEPASGGDPGRKLAKLHGSVSTQDFRPGLRAAEVCGTLAAAVGLVPPGTACLPQDLLKQTSLDDVPDRDAVLCWDGQTLSFTPVP